MGVGRNYPYFYGPSELPVHETRFRFQALSVSFFILSGVSRGVECGVRPHHSVMGSDPTLDPTLPSAGLKNQYSLPLLIPVK